MHPIIAEQTATEIRQRRLAHAATRRRLSTGVSAPASPRRWRARQAARLVALARRLDPAVGESRRLVVR